CSETFNVYKFSDGIQHNEFSAGAYSVTRSGQVLVGGINGFNAFYPHNIRDDMTEPTMVLTDFLLNNNKVEIDLNGMSSVLTAQINQTDAVVLSHTDSVFTFEFSALHYADPNQNRYAYQLEGFDREWVYTDSLHRRATYTNLNAGEYTFKVKGSNSDNVWSAQSRDIKVTIEPAPWLSWWAYTIYGLALFSLIVIFVRVQRNKVHYERAVNLQLKQVDKLKDEFLANTSHELRTPLNGIIGLAESLIDGVTGPLPEQTNANLAMVVASGKRLSNLVNDILDFSKLKNHNLTLNISAVDLHSMVDVVLTLSHHLMKGKKLELINLVPADLPSAQADENRLQQILHNLVGNAIKFTESGSISVIARVADNRLVIDVVDTGIGIAKEKQGNIFESFEQIEGQTERQHSGTGLGLAISTQLVELHGGKLSVDSVLGKGAIFSFSLPITMEKPTVEHDFVQSISRVQTLETHIDVQQYAKLSADGSRDHERHDGHQFRILLVDDEPINRQVLHNHLSMQNYHLIEAEGGEQALEIIKMQSTPFDLVLLDIMMPKVSGYEVCKILRESHAVNDLPVIFLTAKNQVTDLVESFAVGANDYLTKPVLKHELLSRVETHLRLLDINRHLESKVDERTEQLAQKNREIIETQQQLIQSAKMASLGTLTSGVAHEINNPNNFIHVSTENLEVDLARFQQFIIELAGDDADESVLDTFRAQFKPLYAHLSTIKDGSQRIKGIVQDLRVFSQLDAAEQRTVNIAELLQSTINLVQSKYIKVIDFTSDFNPTLELYCYPAQLNQVFLNIIVNGCDAILTRQQQQQDNDIFQGKIVIGGTLTDQLLEVSIRDNGCGMTEESKNKLFEPFYTTKEFGKGTGLGLSISYGIIQKHKGALHVDSELAVGTTFRLSLPVNSPDNH
ncbi:MAG: ATP-binding protein, partial [Psychrosphaera sp.]|nr:ATP-binding protein [Psychrosphaera sp.]